MNKTTEIFVPIENHWRGGYKVEYDGKYITLFGKDANYEQFNYGGKNTYYEEMVLIPIVKEIKKAENVKIIRDEKHYLVIQYE